MTTAAARPRECSIARTLDVVGEKWALLAIREVFLGNHRFDEMIRRPGAPRDTLAARLRTLVTAGVLTEAGRELNPVILMLMRWGDRYLAGQDGPPLILEHSCGHRLEAEVICAACQQPIKAGTTRRYKPV